MERIDECPGAPRKNHRNDPAGELRRLVKDVNLNGIYPEHMDRLSLIAHDIIRIYTPMHTFMTSLSDFENHFERWGVCSDKFWEMHGMCCEVSGLTQQGAVIHESMDDGENEVNSNIV
jgi:hypothetical protein